VRVGYKHRSKPTFHYTSCCCSYCCFIDSTPSSLLGLSTVPSSMVCCDPLGSLAVALNIFRESLIVYSVKVGLSSLMFITFSQHVSVCTDHHRGSTTPLFSASFRDVASVEFFRCSPVSSSCLYWIRLFSFAL
jgi:hypothetical protein